MKHHPSTATVYGYMINGDAAYIYILPTEAAAVKQLMDSWSCCVNKTSIIPIVSINKTYKTLTDRWRFCYTHKFISQSISEFIANKIKQNDKVFLVNTDVTLHEAVRFVISSVSCLYVQSDTNT